ncbi:MAG: bifunctional 3-demethylubiquinone-9 3-methyltransferase/ 2-octaprenyl-6-hydroxy phenol methylase [Methanoregulaceae archaeon PtaB.Bin056]|jgi:2-polyprenyl-3-methyl-5-hydroxy-6-metoxy-1,4-benzoquinol methylase|nr:MAG: bifunctional 3-demethylubiquinone-9 3-methyltransferase/ 2-octaprenyl-6-hydroxy phenol methylase [Methanoregulaceae archaeon PtaB.Bin056]
MNNSEKPIESLSDEDLYRLNIYHRTDDEHSFKQLHSLYGRVNADQDAAIINQVHGRRVLDVGAGYGSLSRRLLDSAFEVYSIEPNKDVRELALAWYDVKELPHSIYDTPFSSQFFDTVILRECVEHLDMPRAMKEISRICKMRLLIFQTNLNPLISLLRGLLGHSEYNPQNLAYYRNCANLAGFSVQTVQFRDILAFPLSGGYVSRQLVPREPLVEQSIIQIDEKLSRFFRFFGADSIVSWRFLLVADKVCFTQESMKK